MYLTNENFSNENGGPDMSTVRNQLMTHINIFEAVLADDLDQFSSRYRVSVWVRVWCWWWWWGGGRRGCFTLLVFLWFGSQIRLLTRDQNRPRHLARDQIRSIERERERERETRKGTETKKTRITLMTTVFSKEVDSTSPDHMFHVLLRSVTDTPSLPHLMSILNHFLLLPGECEEHSMISSKCD
jgi:hypothetical protein